MTAMGSFRYPARQPGAIILMAVTAMLAGQVAAATGAAAAGAGPMWSVQPTPNARVANGQFAAGSCTGPAWCMAVGSTADSMGKSALAEAWNGTSWRVTPVPVPPGGTQSALDGVSCTATTECTAVGSYTTSQGVQATLAEGWNGTSWSVQPTPGPAKANSSILKGVSCGSAGSCIAVGYYDFSHHGQARLVESWQGAAWSLQQNGNPPESVYSVLSGVSCATATRCVAVGNYLNTSSDLTLTLAQAWDGRTWKVLATPNPASSIVNYLNGVSCSSATSCTAVGDWIAGARDSTRRGGPLAATLAEAWNGTSWVIQDTPNPAGTTGIDALDGVSCRSATSCTAVGYSSAGRVQTLGERWNGTAWAIGATPDPGRGHSSLAGVSCGSATTCTAAGSYRNAVGTPQSLAQAWNGSTWTGQAAVSPAGAVPSVLSGVSCASATACTAVGFFRNGPGDSMPLAEEWNGSAWAIERAPGLAHRPNNVLSSVSCSSASFCVAVGKSYAKQSGSPLAEAWNGTAWTIMPAPALSATGGELSGVSCTSAAACIAVGYDVSSAGEEALPLAESWNGTKWTVQNPASPPGGYGISLSSVSCVSPSACTAVGSYTMSGSGRTLAEAWNGSTWSRQAMPAVDGTLYGVSCASAAVCTAVGDSYSYPAGVGPMAEIWRGGAWHLQKTPAIVAYLASFYGVSCRSAKACAAVGGYLEPTTGVAVTLAEAWNGSRWSIQPTPTPRSGTNSVLAGVSRRPATSFTAVGSHLSGAQVSVTLAETGPG